VDTVGAQGAHREGGRQTKPQSSVGECHWHGQYPRAQRSFQQVHKCLEVPGKME